MNIYGLLILGIGFILWFCFQITREVFDWVKLKLQERPVWVIHFSDIFESGYVKHTCVPGKGGTEVRFESEADLLDFASKHRFRIVADILCWVYNLGARSNSFRSFRVKEIVREN